MNRLIILDNLRRGWVRLLVVVGLYLAFVAYAVFPSGRQTLPDPQFFFFVGLFPIVLGSLMRPGLDPIRNELILDTLLPVDRLQLVNTQWLLRTMFPAAVLSISFFLGSLAGLMRPLEASLPPYLPVHLFAAYACGFSVILFSNTLKVRHSDVTWQPKASWGGVLIAVLVSTAYLVLLWNLHDFVAADTVLIGLALLVILATRRAVCSRLVLPTPRRPNLGKDRVWSLPELGTGIGGFRQLWADSFYGSVLSLPILVPIIAWTLIAHPESSIRDLPGLLATTFIPLSCFLGPVMPFQTRTGPALDIRVLRALPLSPGTLALRMILIGCAGLATAYLCLTPLAIWIYGTPTGLYLFNVSVICLAIMTLSIFGWLWLRGIGTQALAAAPGFILLLFILFFVHRGFEQGNYTALAIANLMGFTVLLWSWWLLRRLLCKSSKMYRPKPTPDQP